MSWAVRVSAVRQAETLLHGTTRRGRKFRRCERRCRILRQSQARPGSAGWEDAAAAVYARVPLPRAAWPQPATATATPARARRAACGVFSKAGGQLAAQTPRLTGRATLGRSGAVAALVLLLVLLLAAAGGGHRLPFCAERSEVEKARKTTRRNGWRCTMTLSAGTQAARAVPACAAGCHRWVAERVTCCAHQCAAHKALTFFAHRDVDVLLGCLEKWQQHFRSFTAGVLLAAACACWWQAYDGVGCCRGGAGRWQPRVCRRRHG